MLLVWLMRRVRVRGWLEWFRVVVGGVWLLECGCWWCGCWWSVVVGGVWLGTNVIMLLRAVAIWKNKSLWWQNGEKNNKDIQGGVKRLERTESGRKERLGEEPMSTATNEARRVVGVVLSHSCIST